MTDLDQIFALLQETNYILNIMARNDVRDFLEAVLDSDEKKIAYSASNGENNQSAVKDIAGVSAGSISNWWAEWINLGLAKELSVKGGSRAKRKYDLVFYGIQIPERQ